VVVGTPGRLLDHLNRKSVDPAEVSAIVLDEADRMLDLGFREELEAILDSLPGEHRTHLVSATFPRDVRALADSVQSDAAHVEGTRLGSPNTDIKHVIHLVHPREKLGAIVNLLLATPEAQTLIFARTRADVADIADELDKAGFRVGALSGELEQAVVTCRLSWQRTWPHAASTSRTSRGSFTSTYRPTRTLTPTGAGELAVPGGRARARSSSRLRRSNRRSASSRARAPRTPSSRCRARSRSGEPPTTGSSRSSPRPMTQRPRLMNARQTWLPASSKAATSCVPSGGFCFAPRGQVGHSLAT
jgi:hypothetical protein